MKIAFTLCLPRDEGSVPVARHLLGGSLRKLGVSGGCVYDIELALTEACTNVLRHASGGEDEYNVDVQIEDTECEIRVTDTGHGFDHRSLFRAVPTTAESGRGIRLMQALVDRTDFQTKPRDGTIVCLVKELEIARGSPLARLVSSHN
jgi:serine/threonine-protein kinase RsbW